jgi:hypothetical protein
MKIHISETTKSHLPNKNYKIVERGKIEVKGKGDMKTYFVLCKIDDDGRSIKCPFMEAYEEGKKAQQQFLNPNSTNNALHSNHLANNMNNMNSINNQKLIQNGNYQDSFFVCYFEF